MIRKDEGFEKNAGKYCLSRVGVNALLGRKNNFLGQTKTNLFFITFLTAFITMYFLNYSFPHVFHSTIFFCLYEHFKITFLFRNMVSILQYYNDFRVVQKKYRNPALQASVNQSYTITYFPVFSIIWIQRCHIFLNNQYAIWE